MKYLLKYKPILFIIVALLAVGTMTLDLVGATLTDGFPVFEGEAEIGRGTSVVLTLEGQAAGSTAIYQAKLFGVIPIKKVSASIIPITELIPGGSAFGVKLFTKGVMVSGISEIATAEGPKAPAQEAGIRLKDILTAIDGVPVNTNEEVARLVSQSDGRAMTFTISREGTSLTLEINPALSGDGVYRIGLWVRDSTAGIGTLTFIDPKNGLFGGLGHGICDIDTGELMPLLSGCIVGAKIESVVKGLRGIPGELVGEFDESRPIGDLFKNCEAGIFGAVSDKASLKGKALPAGRQSEITEGKARIICDIGNGPEYFDIKIVRLMNSGAYSTKNMLISVTDEKLLEKTGGIVQGMSGSPIIQNGKLIGAVTHVLVNDPTRGFGIFVENMLSYMQS